MCVGGADSSQRKGYYEEGRGLEKVSTKGVVLHIYMLKTQRRTAVKTPGWEEKNKLEDIMRTYSEKFRCGISCKATGLVSSETQYLLRSVKMF